VLPYCCSSLIVLSVSTLPADLLVDHGDAWWKSRELVRKFYATTEMGTFLAYALEPDCILGWNRGSALSWDLPFSPNTTPCPRLGPGTRRTRPCGLVTSNSLPRSLIIRHYAPADEINRQLADEVQEMLAFPRCSWITALPPPGTCPVPSGRLLGKELRGHALATSWCKTHLGRMLASFQALHSSFQPIPVRTSSPTGAGPLLTSFWPSRVIGGNARVTHEPAPAGFGTDYAPPHRPTPTGKSKRTAQAHLPDPFPFL